MTERVRHRLLSALAWLPLCGLPLGGLPLAASAAGPAPGRHAAELCVSTAAAAAQCGPAELRVGSDGELRVQVSDIVYRLHVGPSRVDVVTMHGPMQVDEFSAEGSWAGDTLRFVDREKRVRYELRLAGQMRS